MNTNNTFANLLLHIEQHIAWITINRPQQLNALNADVLRELTTAVETCGRDPGVRVLVITGACEKAFVAGADIKAMAAMDAAQALDFCALGHRCMDTIAATPQPVIAMVNGFALGGGCELALACDFIYAADTARFALPEVTLGLFPGFGGTQRLTRVVGKAKALELICSGRQLKAQDAYEWGVVNRVVPAAELKPTVAALAAQIAQNSPAAIRLAKAVTLQAGERTLHDGLQHEQATFPECFHTDDRREGLAAFVEKRKPHFTGR